MPSTSQFMQTAIIRFILIFTLLTLFFSMIQHDVQRHVPHSPLVSRMEPTMTRTQNPPPPVIHVHITPPVPTGSAETSSQDRSSRTPRPSRRGIDEVAASLAFLNENQWRTILKNVGRVYASNDGESVEH